MIRRVATLSRLGIGCVLTASLLYSGCALESQRPALGEERETRTTDADVGTTTPPAPNAPVPQDSQNPPPLTPDELGADACPWERVSLVEADLESWGAQTVIVVKAKAPETGWHVVLEAIESDDGAMELQVVGHPGDPDSATSHSAPTQRTILQPVKIGAEIDQVVVHGSDGAMVLPVD